MHRQQVRGREHFSSVAVTGHSILHQPGSPPAAKAGCIYFWRGPPSNPRWGTFADAAGQRDNGKTPAVLEHVDIFIFVPTATARDAGGQSACERARIEIASCRIVRGRDVAWRRLAKSRLPASSHPPRPPSSRSPSQTTTSSARTTTHTASSLLAPFLPPPPPLILPLPLPLPLPLDISSAAAAQLKPTALFTAALNWTSEPLHLPIINSTPFADSHNTPHSPPADLTRPPSTNKKKNTTLQHVAHRTSHPIIVLDALDPPLATPTQAVAADFRAGHSAVAGAADPVHAHNAVVGPVPD